MTLRNSLHNSSCLCIPLCAVDFITRDPPSSSQLQLILALRQLHSSQDAHFNPIWGSDPRHDIADALSHHHQTTCFLMSILWTSTAGENNNNDQYIYIFFKSPPWKHVAKPRPSQFKSSCFYKSSIHWPESVQPDMQTLFFSIENICTQRLSPISPRVSNNCSFAYSSLHIGCPKFWPGKNQG